MKPSLTILLLSLVASSAGVAQTSPVATVKPGGLVRWAGPSLLSCSIGDRSWAPRDGACWYPIDLGATGTVELVRRSTGGVNARLVEVGAYPYPTQHLSVADKYVEPPLEVAARIEREQLANEALFALETHGLVPLPLASPLEKLPRGGRFGARRVFNGEARSPHSGADYAVPTGTPVRAVADGDVVLAEELYFAGNAVYVDHGDGLLSMSLHLSSIAVTEGQSVRKGDVIGRVGATGRVTGPHLHFGLRWHGARIDPALVLERVEVVDIR
jgi:murein DD-endopeptidase MepM/ murein hydrolase activator NlpD